MAAPLLERGGDSGHSPRVAKDGAQTAAWNRTPPSVLDSDIGAEPAGSPLLAGSPRRCTSWRRARRVDRRFESHRSHYPCQSRRCRLTSACSPRYNTIADARSPTISHRPRRVRRRGVVHDRVREAGLGAARRDARRDAIDATLSSGARVALARADSAAVRARLLTARALANPSLAAGYSKSAPQGHVWLEIPLDAPWTRRARIGAAGAAVRAARPALCCRSMLAAHRSKPTRPTRRALAARGALPLVATERARSGQRARA